LIVARHNDPTVLLPHLAERVLSSLVETQETSASSLAARLRTPLEEILNQLSWLADQGLVRQTGESPKAPHYAMTEGGASHPQYRPDVTKARPVSLPVRSDRVREVLSYLANHGPARIVHLRDALDISHGSINALAQYLKRKGLIRKIDDSREAPFELTTEGLNTQRAMIQRSGAERA